MAVLLETSKGDIVIDLFYEETPLASKNFLKLCKIKYYNHCLFHNVQKDFIIQTGDPTGTGKGGTSIYGKLYGEQAKYFEDEVRPQLKHTKTGYVSMASAGENTNASQFYITTNENLDSLDGKHTIFGEVSEGLDVVARINEAFCDEQGRPWQNIRIRHTMILEDPFDDPPGLAELIPVDSPKLVRSTDDNRLEDDWQPVEDTRPAEEIEKSVRKEEAHSRAVVLEMIGDLPDAEAKPEDNIIFVCKLNPVTSEEDLEIIFSRFGKVTTCDVIRDWKTGESLSYAFIGFETKEAAEQAYFKMDNVLIDDRRIHVDFYQSMYHQWRMYKKTGRFEGPGKDDNKEKRSEQYRHGSREPHRHSSMARDPPRDDRYGRDRERGDRRGAYPESSGRDRSYQRGGEEEYHHRKHRRDRRRSRSRSPRRDGDYRRHRRSPDRYRERRERRHRSRSPRDSYRR